ncbi:hypothetical protein DPM19_06805 [Actinomadura craniellae]|uniref:Uncharacterized protein n=1 Tax=Actinomadura craniellae TaxID=2231787 RepID=A0A365H8Z9_9ACTN|nr:hypothetical protein DPM19_06805 [Actinomadura craniellae]
MRRYEEARQARARRRDALARRAVGWIMAAALALLAYDSAAAALADHRAGRSWAYPAVLALGCAVAAATLVFRLVRHRVTRGRTTPGVD